MISRILGDVEERCWGCCNEFVSDRGTDVLSAVEVIYQDWVRRQNWEENMNLNCHIAESLYRCMPYSGLEKRNVTRALRWRKIKTRRAQP